MFNDPQIKYFKFFKSFKQSPHYLYTFKTFEKLLKEEPQLNWVIFGLNEILARYLRKKVDINEKQMLLTVLPP